MFSLLFSSLNFSKKELNIEFNTSLSIFHITTLCVGGVQDDKPLGVIRGAYASVCRVKKYREFWFL